MVPNVEEFGIAAVEAQAAGRPVVAVDAGGTRETVIDGETGVLVPDGDPNTFAEALAEVDFAAFSAARSGRTPSVSRRSASRALHGGDDPPDPIAPMRLLFVNHTAVESGAEMSLLDLVPGCRDTVSARVACPPGELADDAPRPRRRCAT